MASISFPALPPPPATPLQVGPVAAIAPAVAASLADGAGAPALPFSKTLAANTGAPGQGAPEAGAEGAAMRPDQAVMARQLAYVQQDGAALARAWRAQVRSHGSQLTSRALASSSGQLSPASLAAAQQGQVVHPADTLAAHQDAWRFTVHADGRTAQHLDVRAEDPDQPPGRRKRPRAALRLTLELADGSVVMLQAEPLPGGIALELCAPDARALARLRDMQPTLESVMARCGVTVLRWGYRDRFPSGSAHASAAYAEAAAQSLTPAVFRAVAELALLLPA